MPADPSSPIPAALTQHAHTDPRQLQHAEAPQLLAYLTTIPDPRAARGRRHPLIAILGLAAAAVLAGVRSIAAIAEWVADAPAPVRAGLGARQQAPAASPYRPRPPSAERLLAWTPTPWPTRSPGWPTSSVPLPQPAASGPSP